MFDFSSWSLYAAYGALALQEVIGIIFIEHGWAKLSKRTTPKPYKILGLVEILASLSVMLYWQDRLGAVVLAIVMIGAIYFKTFKWKVPFMSHEKLGWEFDLILLAAALAIATKG